MSNNVKLIIEIPKPMYESVQNGTYCGTLYEELKNGIPLDENKGEWIPVTKRLPEPEEKQEVKVIVSYENEDGEFVEKGVFNKRYGFNFPSVKAWQPLPEPYKAESEDKEPPIFSDSAPLKDCKNTAESYGEICVRCNKCGRFGKEKE